MNDGAILALMLSFVTCGIIGAVIGSCRKAGVEGFLMGFLLGPLGLIAAFTLDKREQCPFCNERLNDKPRICPHCRTDLEWGKLKLEEEREAAQRAAKEAAEKARQREEAEAERQLRAIEAKRAERERRRQQRDDWYRALGVAPGPLAWFDVLPEAVRLCLIGAALSIPVLATLFFIRWFIQ